MKTKPFLHKESYEAGWVAAVAAIQNLLDNEQWTGWGSIKRPIEETLKQTIECLQDYGAPR